MHIRIRSRLRLGKARRKLEFSEANFSDRYTDRRSKKSSAWEFNKRQQMAAVSGAENSTRAEDLLHKRTNLGLGSFMRNRLSDERIYHSGR